MNRRPGPSAGEELAPHVDPRDGASVDAMASALQRDRPRPRPAFGAQLRERLAAMESRPKRMRVGRMRLLIASYSVAGAACLAVAALSLAGAGPLAP